MSDAVRGAMRQGLQQAVHSPSLPPKTLKQALATLLSGRASEGETAALLALMRARGETSEELTVTAQFLLATLQADTLVEHPQRSAPELGDLVDTCGTGGDSAHLFNISTAAAIVVSACGVAVAKHGNRSVTSRSGSADLLEQAGIRIDLPPGAVRRCIAETGIGFAYAPHYFAAMRHVSNVRRLLPFPTLFNLVGPLANPLPLSYQLVGVFDESRVEPMAQALRALGRKGAWVVHGAGGLDEVAPHGPTRVAVLRNDAIAMREISPEDFGMDRSPLEAARGGDAARNADLLQRLLQAEPVGPRTMVLLNAAATLCAIDARLDPKQAMVRVRQAVDEGRAYKRLQTWIAWTQNHPAT